MFNSKNDSLADQKPLSFELRNTKLSDIDAIIELCEHVYPGMYGWGPNQLTSHLEIFPEGQFVVTHEGRVVGMAASMVVDYSQHDLLAKWKDITDWGYLGTHEPETGRTLYGVEIMVHPDYQGKGVGKLLYRKREAFAKELGMLNIRAGARISGYHLHASEFTAREYVIKVIKNELSDPTLSFQLKRGFRAIGITPFYFHDPASLNHAVVIEWLNPDIATAEDAEQGDKQLLEVFKALPKLS